MISELWFAETSIGRLSTKIALAIASLKASFVGGKKGLLMKPEGYHTWSMLMMMGRFDGPPRAGVGTELMEAPHP